MTYEIIAIENGDILDRFSDMREAADALQMYVDAHRATFPGIENQVGLLELDDADHPTGECLTYADLTYADRHATTA
jgi:hypothetical protein